MAVFKCNCLVLATTDLVNYNTKFKVPGEDREDSLKI